MSSKDPLKSISELAGGDCLACCKTDELEQSFGCQRLTPRAWLEKELARLLRGLGSDIESTVHENGLRAAFRQAREDLANPALRLCGPAEKAALSSVNARSLATRWRIRAADVMLWGPHETAAQVAQSKALALGLLEAASSLDAYKHAYKQGDT